VKPEFSRPERVDTIGEGARDVTIAADAAERAALARRFGLVSVERLGATLSLHRQGDAIVAAGIVEAAVVQACTVTGDPLPATVRETVTLRFVEAAGGGEEEVELSGDAADTIEIDGGAVDLGEAAAETMALALDPFPRSARAAALLRDAGVLTEEEARPANPFAALKNKLSR